MANERELLSDEAVMALAMSAGERARFRSSPNPWVGAVLVSPTGECFEGATEEPGGRHAEIVALDAAQELAKGATLYVTLEPCAHHGRTGPWVEAILRAGVTRVVVGIGDPDGRVNGEGVARLVEAGIEVTEGVLRDDILEQLAPYLVHRRTGRPYVILKMATTLDGQSAAADGSSQWITGEAARADVHRLRAASDVVLVGAGTVAADNPALTARGEFAAGRQPRRVVLGPIPEGAKVLPAESVSGDLGELLDDFGAQGALQVLVEGGARVAKAFLDQHLVNRLVLYVAPALMGGDDGIGLFSGPGASSIEALRRGRFVSVAQLGEDLRLEVEI